MSRRAQGTVRRSRLLGSDRREFPITPKQNREPATPTQLSKMSSLLRSTDALCRPVTSSFRKIPVQYEVPLPNSFNRISLSLGGKSPAGVVGCSSDGNL